MPVYGSDCLLEFKSDNCHFAAKYATIFSDKSISNISFCSLPSRSSLLKSCDFCKNPPSFAHSNSHSVLILPHKGMVLALRSSRVKSRHLSRVDRNWGKDRLWRMLTQANYDHLGHCNWQSRVKIMLYSGWV